MAHFNSDPSEGAFMWWDPTPILSGRNPMDRTRRFFLTSETLQRIQSPNCPIYHAWPGLGYTFNSEGLLYDQRKQRLDCARSKYGHWNPLAAVGRIHVDYEAQLHTPFLERLKAVLPASPADAPREVTWQSVLPPNQPSTWGHGEGLNIIIYESLFKPTAALLRLVNSDITIKIEHADPDGRPSSTADDCGHYLISHGEHVAMVVNFETWFPQEALQFMRDTTGQVVRPTDDADTPRNPQQAISQQDLEAARYDVLSQLGRHMLMYNAPQGAVYTGTDMIIFRRNYSHDLEVLAAIEAYEASPADSPFPEIGTKLEAFDLGLAHPADPRPSTAGSNFIQPNPTWALAAIVSQAIGFLEQRPSALDGYERKIRRYINSEPPKPSIPFNDCPSPSAVFAEWKLARFNPPLPSSAVAFVEVVHAIGGHMDEVSALPCDDQDANAKTESDSSQPAPAAVLAAFGHLETREPYFLVLEGHPSGKSRKCHIHRGFLYRYAELPPKHWLSGWETAPPASAQLQGDTSEDRPRQCKADYLYMARGGVAEAMHRHVNEDIAAGVVTDVRAVVFKMPWLLFSPQDPQRNHLYERGIGGESARSPPSLQSLVKCLERDHRAYSILTKEAHDEAPVVPPRPLTVTLSCRASKSFVDEHWLGVWTLLAWPHYPILVDVGVSIQDMLVYIRDQVEIELEDEEAPAPPHALAASQSRVAATVDLLLGYSSGTELYQTNMAELGHQAIEKLHRMHELALVHNDCHTGNICVAILDNPGRVGLEGVTSPQVTYWPGQVNRLKQREAGGDTSSQSPVSNGNDGHSTAAEQKDNQDDRQGAPSASPITANASSRVVVTFLDLGESGYHPYGIPRDVQDNGASEGQAQATPAAPKVSYSAKLALDSGIASDEEYARRALDSLEYALEAMAESRRP